jgi:hypothetical protein
MSAVADFVDENEGRMMVSGVAPHVKSDHTMKGLTPIVCRVVERS